MTDNATRIAGGLLLLLGLWVAVYWTWPTEPRISFADGPTVGAGHAPMNPSVTGAGVPPVSGPTTDGGPAAPVSIDATPPTSPTTSPDGSSSADASGPRLIPPQFTPHTVAAGETFVTISKKYFGTGLHADAIAKANPFVDPTRLRAGRVIRIPKDPGNIQGKVVDADRPSGARKPAGGASSEYVVQSGDTLSKIAKQVYGEERLASRIFDANKDRMASPDKLRLGMKLRIPAKE